MAGQNFFVSKGLSKTVLTIQSSSGPLKVVDDSEIIRKENIENMTSCLTKAPIKILRFLHSIQLDNIFLRLFCIALYWYHHTFCNYNTTAFVM